MSSSEETGRTSGHHKKRRVRVIESDGSSSDDSLIISRRKKTPRVLSSSSSSSEESDSGSEIEVKDARRRKRLKDKAVVESSGAETDNSSTGGSGSGCPICLGKLDGTALQGRPEGCEHIFCFECIIVWSRNNTTCPLCRASFRSIKILLQGAVLEDMPVKQITPEELDLNAFVNDIICRVCMSSDNEDTLLLCDECDDAYHCACLNPPLASVPPGQWFCPRCSRVDVDEDENQSLMDGDESLYIPRTRATERVRRAVQSTRRGAGAGRSRGQRSSASSSRRRQTTSGSSTSRSKKTRGSTSRKRRSTGTTRRRKVGRRSRRRKGGRRKTIVRKAFASSVDHQCRIAKSLGLSDRVLNKLNRNSFGYSALSMDEPSTSRGFAAFEVIKVNRGGIAGVVPDLHVFGNRHNYEPGGGSEDEAPRSQSATRPPSPPASSSGDLLGGLLEKQSVLLSRKSELKRDSSGKVVLVNESVAGTQRSTLAPSTSSSTLSRKHSIENSSKRCPSSSAGSEVRPTVSKEGVDMHYKPSRVSRVDQSSFANYETTIDDVLHKVMSGEPETSRKRPRTESDKDSSSTLGNNRNVSSRCLERLRDIADAAIAGTTVKDEIPDTTSNNHEDNVGKLHIKQEPKTDFTEGYAPIKIKVETSTLYGPEQPRRTVLVGGDSSIDADHSPSYAGAKHNLERRKALKSAHGWINSLRLTTPTVINSLNAFSDIDIEPSPSLLVRHNIKVEPSDPFDFDLSRVKKEPLDYGEVTSLTSTGSNEKTKSLGSEIGSGLSKDFPSSEKVSKQGRSPPREHGDRKSSQASSGREKVQKTKDECYSSRGSGGSRRSRSRSYERRCRSKSPKIKKESRRERSSSRDKGSPRKPVRVKKEYRSPEHSPSRSVRIKKEKASRERSVSRSPRQDRQIGLSRDRRIEKTEMNIKKERRSTDRTSSRSSHERQSKSDDLRRRRSRSRSHGSRDRSSHSTRSPDKDGNRRRGRDSPPRERFNKETGSDSRSRDATEFTGDRSKEECRRRTEYDERRQKGHLETRVKKQLGERLRRSVSSDEHRRDRSTEKSWRKQGPVAKEDFKQDENRDEDRSRGEPKRRERSRSIEKNQRRRSSSRNSIENRGKESSNTEYRKMKTLTVEEQLRSEGSLYREPSEGINRMNNDRRSRMSRSRDRSSSPERSTCRKLAESKCDVKELETSSQCTRTYDQEKNLRHDENTESSVSSSVKTVVKMELDHLKIEPEEKPSSSRQEKLQDQLKTDNIRIELEAGVARSAPQPVPSPFTTSAMPHFNAQIQPTYSDDNNPVKIECSSVDTSKSGGQMSPVCLTPAFNVGLQGGRPVLLVPGPIAGTFVMPGAETEVQPPQPASSTTPSHHGEGYSSGVDSDENNFDELELTSQVQHRLQNANMNNNDEDNNAALENVETKLVRQPKVKEKLPKFFVESSKFQETVVKEVGSYLKKFYKKHQISKEDYKEIFKKVMKKICKNSNEPKRVVCVRSIRKLCDFYVQKARLQIKKDCMFSDDVA